jgi:hypothetical protein
MKKIGILAMTLFVLTLVGFSNAAIAPRMAETKTEVESRTVTVYYNFVRVGSGAYSHQTTSGEFDSDEMVIVINGKACSVEQCSYYRMRQQGMTVDDPRADYPYQAYCRSLNSTVYF